MKYIFALVLVIGASLLANEEKLELKVTAPEDVYCNSTTYGDYITSSSKCYYGDVMTGIYSISPLKLRCSRLSVTCSRIEKATD